MAEVVDKEQVETGEVDKEQVAENDEKFEDIFNEHSASIWQIFLKELGKFPDLHDHMRGYYEKALCATLMQRLIKKNQVFAHKEAADFLFKRFYDGKSDVDDDDEYEYDTNKNKNKFCNKHKITQKKAYEAKGNNEVQNRDEALQNKFPWVEFPTKFSFYCKLCRITHKYVSYSILHRHSKTLRHQKNSESSASPSSSPSMSSLPSPSPTSPSTPSMPLPSTSSSLEEFLEETKNLIETFPPYQIENFKTSVENLCRKFSLQRLSTTNAAEK
ncbi:uncharacterized protein LOC142222600 [Haematobia irritans]|uniref:uncharacterized protein LOC142222600 n=1 Tax=Haematobia irritans TaxID=7368 RepID=UPI003F504FC7